MSLCCCWRRVSEADEGKWKGVAKIYTFHGGSWCDPCLLLSFQIDTFHSLSHSLFLSLSALPSSQGLKTKWGKKILFNFTERVNQFFMTFAPRLVFASNNFSFGEKAPFIVNIKSSLNRLTCVPLKGFYPKINSIRYHTHSHSLSPSLLHTFWMKSHQMPWEEAWKAFCRHHTRWRHSRVCTNEEFIHFFRSLLALKNSLRAFFPRGNSISIEHVLKE